MSVQLPYIVLAAAAGLFGGTLAAVWKPAAGARSAIQHFAAGVVLAAVAGRVIPEVQEIGNPAGILAGFAAGGIAMIGLKSVVVRIERRDRHAQRMPLGLALAAAIDTLLDGAIISAGFSVGEGLGILLAAALATELFFLTLSVGSEFRGGRGRRWTGIAATTGISALLIVGALASAPILARVSPAGLAAALAFGAAALIYLIAEELLVETPQAEASVFSTAMLFLGFAVLLALMLAGPPTGAGSGGPPAADG